MTQAHVDLEFQLDKQTTCNLSNLTATSLCNNSPIPFLDPVKSLDTPTLNKWKLQIQSLNLLTKVMIHLLILSLLINSFSTPPLSKRKFDKIKDAAFPTIPVYPAKVSPKDALSFQRDEHLLPLL